MSIFIGLYVDFRMVYLNIKMILRDNNIRSTECHIFKIRNEAKVTKTSKIL